MREPKIGVANTVSRRALIAGGSTAAIVGGLSGHGLAASQPREMTWSGRRTRDGGDRHLSLVFRRNAYGFHRAAVDCQVRFPANTLYFLAIAIELSLKAYLLHRGVSDDWSRAHIGHNLDKALTCAKRTGFRHVPGDLPDLASRLTPYYERHAISRHAPKIMSSRLLSQACTTVHSLLRGIAAQIDQEAANEDRTAQRRRESAHA